MKRSRTPRTAQATSSTDEKSRTVTINLTAPTSWREMSQEQLRYVFDLMAIEQEPTAIKTYMLIYFTRYLSRPATSHSSTMWPSGSTKTAMGVQPAMGMP